MVGHRVRPQRCVVFHQDYIPVEIGPLLVRKVFPGQAGQHSGAIGQRDAFRKTGAFRAGEIQARRRFEQHVPIGKTYAAARMARLVTAVVKHRIGTQRIAALDHQYISREKDFPAFRELHGPARPQACIFLLQAHVSDETPDAFALLFTAFQQVGADIHLLQAGGVGFLRIDRQGRGCGCANAQTHHKTTYHASGAVSHSSRTVTRPVMLRNVYSSRRSSASSAYP